MTEGDGMVGCLLFRANPIITNKRSDINNKNPSRRLYSRNLGDYSLSRGNQVGKGLKLKDDGGRWDVGCGTELREISWKEVRDRMTIGAG